MRRYHFQTLSSDWQAHATESLGRTSPLLPWSDAMFLLYVHWSQAEAKNTMASLKAAGHEVVGHWKTGENLRLGQQIPDAVVISLDRLPSHGRAVAEWFQEGTKRRGNNLVFVGGKSDKVDAARKQFPKAHFCQP